MRKALVIYKCGPDGYYRIGESGTLRAVIHYRDGTSDILEKKMMVR